MTMPKAPMNENRLLAFSKSNVRFPGQIAAMKSIAIAHPVEKPTHDHLWLGIPAMNTRHPLAAFGGRKSIHFSIVSLIRVMVLRFASKGKAYRTL